MTNTSENDRTSADGFSAGGSKRNRTTGGDTAVLKRLFRAVVAAIARRDEDDPPTEARRGRGETDKGFVKPGHDRNRQASQSHGEPGKAAARGRYAALQTKPQKPPKVRRKFAAAAGEAAAKPVPPKSYVAAGLYLADTLAWLNLWEANSGNNELDAHFDTQQDRHFPQP